MRKKNITEIEKIKSKISKIKSTIMIAFIFPLIVGLIILAVDKKWQPDKYDENRFDIIDLKVNTSYIEFFIKNISRNNQYINSILVKQDSKILYYEIFDDEKHTLSLNNNESIHIKGKFVDDKDLAGNKDLIFVIMTGDNKDIYVEKKYNIKFIISKL